MKVLDFIYNETTISFEPTGTDDVMVNATEMANAFGKRVKDFLRNEKTRDFLKILEKNEGNKTGNTVLFESENDEKTEVQRDISPFENEFQAENIPSEDEFTTSENILKVVKGGRNSGTWMHRILALKFSGWLDADFEYWVWKTTDQIILGHYREVRQATIEKIQAEKELEEEKKQLLAKYPELASFIDKQNSISDIDKKRLKALRAATDQLRLDFDKNQ